MRIDDYRELLMEEEMIEELYYAVLAMHRLVEHFKSPKTLVRTDEVLKRFGLTREELEGTSDEGGRGVV